MENHKTLMKDIIELNKWRDIPMSMDRKTQYCQEVSSSQLDLQIQCNPNQNPSKIFYRYSQTDSKVSVERQKTQNSQFNTEGEEQSQKTYTT